MSYLGETGRGSLPDIDKIIVELVEPALPDRLSAEGKIQKFTDARLITIPFARAGFDCHRRDGERFETIVR